MKYEINDKIIERTTGGLFNDFGSFVYFPHRIKTKLGELEIYDYIPEIKKTSENTLNDIATVVRAGFEKNMDFEDIRKHVTEPENLYLLYDSKNYKNRELLAMASFNRVNISGFSALIVEGIAITPKMQGKGFFSLAADLARENYSEKIICLRTQNPRMYRALENYCYGNVYPKNSKTPNAINEIIKDFAKYSNCKITENSVVKGYYGGLFYGKKPIHEKTSPIFDNLGVDLDNGDALMAVGIK